MKHTYKSRSVIKDALYGEPLTVPAPGHVLDTRSTIWTVGEWPIAIPASEPRRSRDAIRSVASLRQWTGWSNRRIAQVLGTSHTTINEIEDGRPLNPVRSGELTERLRDAFEVVKRVYLLADKQPELTAHALETAPQGGRPAVDHLREGQPARAHLAALDVLRPRKSGMLTGIHPRIGDATVPLHD